MTRSAFAVKRLRAALVATHDAALLELADHVLAIEDGRHIPR